MYYIYAYIDPRTNLPFYIGKGKGDRMFAHLRTAQAKRDNPDKAKVINDLLEAGLTPIIQEIESNILNEVEAYQKEEKQILLYGRYGIDLGGILTNKSLHSRPPIPIWDDAKKKKHSEFNASYWTEDRKLAHRPIAKENAIKGGMASMGTVPVVDMNNVTMRISRELYLAVDRSKPNNEQEFVSTASKEGRRRLTSPP